MTADHIARARDIIERYLPAMPDQQAAFVTRDAARALEDAGLLTTPERDAEVRAEALRGAEWQIAECDDEVYEGHCHDEMHVIFEKTIFTIILYHSFLF